MSKTPKVPLHSSASHLHYIITTSPLHIHFYSLYFLLLSLEQNWCRVYWPTFHARTKKLKQSCAFLKTTPLQYSTPPVEGTVAFNTLCCASGNQLDKWTLQIYTFYCLCVKWPHIYICILIQLYDFLSILHFIILMFFIFHIHMHGAYFSYSGCFQTPGLFSPCECVCVSLCVSVCHRGKMWSSRETPT